MFLLILSPLNLKNMTTDETEDYFDQKETIKKFIFEFYKKYGYRPIVLSNATVDDNELQIISLEELKESFRPFLPSLYGKTVFLDKRCRIREVVELRQMFCYLAREMGYKLTDIGKALKQADHSTAVHSINVFRNMMETDPKYRRKFSMILNYVKQKGNESSTMADSDTVEDNA